MNKKTFIVLAIILPILSSFLLIRTRSAKITTFEECENAGWFVRNIRIYDSVGGYGSVERECILWSGKSFYLENKN